MTFASQVRALRQQRRLTQRLAAERCGVTTVTFWNWEKGRSTPWPKDQAKHLAALGGEPSKLKCTCVVTHGYHEVGCTLGLGVPSARRRIIDNLGSLEP